ncbi:MAG: hypothetical protein ACQEQM_02030 [Thermoplasmatota archaeon]
MQIILDENLPIDIKEEIKDIHNQEDILDVEEEYKGILDLKLVDKMEEDDIMATRDLELHKNLLDMGKKSVYYDIQTNNIVEVQIKLKYYLKNYDISDVENVSKMNEHISPGPNSLLRKRFEELKQENSELKCRVNVLEGKLESIHNTVESVVDKNQR